MFGLGAPSGSAAHQYNIYNANTSVNLHSGTTADPTEIVGEDPLLDANYHLRYGSPAIDAGVMVDPSNSDPTPDLGAFQYQGSGNVTGTVTDGTYPIAGATVTTVNQSATTGANGTYTILNTEAGPYSVTASAGGYYPATQTTTVPLGGTVTGVNFALAAKPPVTYYVESGGNDTNSGLSTNAPWASVSNGDAKGILNAGDTVIVVGPSPIETPTTSDSLSACPIDNCSGTASRPITYTAINYGYIDTSSGGYGPQINANYIVFNGLRSPGQVRSGQWTIRYPISYRTA